MKGRDVLAGCRHSSNKKVISRFMLILCQSSAMPSRSDKSAFLPGGLSQSIPKTVRQSRKTGVLSRLQRQRKEPISRAPPQYVGCFQTRETSSAKAWAESTTANLLRHAAWIKLTQMGSGCSRAPAQSMPRMMRGMGIDLRESLNSGSSLRGPSSMMGTAGGLGRIKRAGGGVGGRGTWPWLRMAT